MTAQLDTIRLRARTGPTAKWTPEIMTAMTVRDLKATKLAIGKHPRDHVRWLLRFMEEIERMDLAEMEGEELARRREEIWFFCAMQGGHTAHRKLSALEIHQLAQIVRRDLTSLKAGQEWTPTVLAPKVRFNPKTGEITEYYSGDYDKLFPFLVDRLLKDWCNRILHCARDKCPHFFVLTKQNNRKWCSESCGNLIRQRDKRDRDRRDKDQKREARQRHYYAELKRKDSEKAKEYWDRVQQKKREARSKNVKTN